MTRKSALCLSLVLAATCVPAGAAIAASDSFTDGHTTSGPMDIHRVSVTNEKRLQIRIKVDNLQRKAGRSAAAWLDTDKDRKGPEFFIGSGLFDSDWQITRTDGWQPVGDPLSCDIDQMLRYKKDVISWTTGKDCLGEYSAVRVSAEAEYDGTRDYSPDKHMFHPWVDRY